MIRFQKAVLVLVMFCVNVFGYNVKDAPLLKSRPVWLKACQRNSTNQNECLTDLFAKMFPYLAVGIPEINVDPFEPLPLDKVSISKGSGAITLTGSLDNMIVAGPSNSTPTWTDEKDRHWNFGLHLPLLNIKSQYNLKGNILVLPLIGHGNCELKLIDTKTKITTEISFIKKQGREVLHVDNMDVHFKVGAMKVKFYNLFNGNKILGQTVNTFINQNAIQIIEELEDSIGASLAEIFTKLLNNIYSKIPTDLWYLNEEEFKIYRKEINEENKSDQPETTTTKQS